MFSHPQPIAISACQNKTEDKCPHSWPQEHFFFSLSLSVLWLSMSAHTFSTYVTSPVSCTTLSSVVLPWKEQLSWELFWPYPNVYLTHAQTPLPPYSHVRAEYYKILTLLLTCSSRLFTIYQFSHSGFIVTDCSNFTFAPFILFHVLFYKYRCTVEQSVTDRVTTSRAQKQIVRFVV